MITLVLLILALICFIIEAFHLNRLNVNLIALGLAFWVLSLLIR